MSNETSALAAKLGEIDLSVETTLHWRSAHSLVQFLVAGAVNELVAVVASTPVVLAAVMKAAGLPTVEQIRALVLFDANHGGCITGATIEVDGDTFQVKLSAAPEVGK